MMEDKSGLRGIAAQVLAVTVGLAGDWGGGFLGAIFVKRECLFQEIVAVKEARKR
jgi:hypothetical protein